MDLTTLDWPPIVLSDVGVEIAATCTFAQLAAFDWPMPYLATKLVEPCCCALLGSFKVWNLATVGGNICLALPAAPMTAFATALDATALIWTPHGTERRVPIEDLVIGDGRTSLEPGEVLRAIELPAAALRRRTALRRASLCAGGRSAALLIGTRDAEAFALTITASTRRPVRLHFEPRPTADRVRTAIDAAIPSGDYHDDVHGRPPWRRHLTYTLAEEIRRQIAET